MILNPIARADAFHKRLPRFSPLVVWNDRLYGCWLIGALFARGNGYYGAFPHSVKERIYALFPDCPNVCHLFSGTVNDFGSITYDINPTLHPTICDDVRNIEKHKKELENCQLFVADPPYEKHDFEKYGVKPFNRYSMMRDIAKGVPIGAFLAWLDVRMPQYGKKDWNLLGCIGVVVSTNTRMRVLTLLQRQIA